MTDLRQETVDTYNKSAKEYAQYFKGFGPRIRYIEQAWKLAGNPKQAKVVEIGCGDGRDAKEIIKRTKNYTGFDISEGFIKLAKKQIPNGKFEVADAATYKFSNNLDIVFAFASLLHLDKDEFRQVLRNVHKALKPAGIFYISVKYAPAYQEYIKKDEHGQRLFYFYHLELIEELAGKDYKTVYSERETIGHTDWLEVALRKI